MILQHRPDRKHTKAKSLSWIPYWEVPCDQFIQGIEPKDLLCGGVVDSQCGAFTQEVDNAVPLTSLGISDTKGVLHDAQGVQGTGGGSHGEPQGPMVCDTCLDADQYSSEGQWYQDISAETAESGQITKLKESLASQFVVMVESRS